MNKVILLLTVLFFLTGCSVYVDSHEYLGNIKSVSDLQYGLYNICTIEFDNGRIKTSDFDNVCLDYYFNQSVYEYSFDSTNFIYYSTNLSYILSRYEK